ncbi:MAG: AsmA family protein [Desulfovibrio sp.]|jgi:AsmA protein|nr:AsmA family protein [Desulfovibrio sp.]
MRKKLLVILLCVLGALGTASGAAVWWTARYLATPEFRLELAQLVEEATGRKARLDGELSLSFFPWFGLKARGFSLGNDPRFGETPLISASLIGARIRVLPLFQRRLVFDTVELENASIVLTMDAEGRGNWEGLLERLREQEHAKEKAGSFFRRITMRGLQLTDSMIRLDDHANNHSYITTDVDLRTGRIEAGRELPFTASCEFTWPRPGMFAKVSGSGKLHWSADDSQPLLTETSARAEITGTFMPKEAPWAQLSTNLSVEGGGKHLKLSDIRLRIVGYDVAGELSFLDITEMFRLEAKLNLERFSPRTVINAYWPGTIAHDSQGALSVAYGPLNISADVNKLVFETPGFTVDHAQVKGFVRMGFDNGSGLDFDLATTNLDADALITAFTSNSTSQPLVVADLPMDYLRAVHGAGKVKAEGLKLAGVTGQGALVEWQGGGGAHKAQIRPTKAQGGLVSAELAATFAEGPHDPRPLSGPGAPILGWSGALSMLGVDARQVSWLSRPGFTTTGRMDLRAKAEAKAAPAVHSEKLSRVLKRASAEVQASLSAPALEWAADKGQKGQPGSPANGAAPARRMAFSSIQAQARFAPAPSGDADWALQTDGTISAVGAKPVLNLDARVNGLLRSQGGRLLLTGATASGRLKGWFLPRRENEASFSGRGSLDFSTQALNLTAASVQACGLNVSGPVTGSKVLGGDWSLAGRIRCQDGDPRRVLNALDIRAPKSADKRALQRISGEGDLTLSAKGATLANFSGQLDDVPLRGSYSVQNFDAPRQTVNVSAGNFDLDRYLPAPEPTRRGGPPEKPTPEPLPVDTLRELNLEGSLALRSLKYKGAVTRDLKLTAKAGGGQLQVKPISGSFYGGTLSGEFSAQVVGSAMQTRLALALKDYQSGPFMLGWTGKELVTGKTDLFLDVTGTGATNVEVLRTLEGLGSFKITDGAYHLSGAAEAPAQPAGQPQQARRSGATSMQQGQQAGQPQPARKAGSPFNQAQARLKISQGWFRSDDFRLDAPTMTVTGKGRFSPAEDQIAVDLNASMTGMPDVPIRVYGRLKDPEMEISTGTLISNTIKGILGIPLKPIKFFKDLLF